MQSENSVGLCGQILFYFLLKFRPNIFILSFISQTGLFYLGT